MARCPPCLHLQLLFRLLWGWRTKVILWCCDAEYPIYWSTTKWEEHKGERQKKQKSMGFNLRIKKTKRKRKKWGSHRNEKRKRLRRRASSTTEPGGVRGEEGHFLQKGVSFFFTYREKEQKKSLFLPPGCSVKPNQCLVWQCCLSPRHQLTMEESLGRHTSHFQSASSRTGLKAGKDNNAPQMFKFS